MKTPPCKGCEDRYVGCHAKCPDYKDFKNYTNEVRQRRKEKRDLDSFYYDQMNMRKKRR